ncbi:HNH endonuclease [Mesorhizobium sp.]|uniref:HNH endonuclease n=1 Tax=Mesorhizobium sp. TaxID=1871066 RepID=UPI000FE36504|nr:HNH endonuclease [Mesorhizobium sp.]RWN51500.1 MAG: HNH endonuclease [Mesorhizobium sp.]RWN72179.1 MAG: HNH endonuclease [Mesorhizobium sp.]RWN73400.1 MAG: HNH endonuclease [Mesorhizobium sp.]RWN85711.1 MAG: HNH endonuclease [Mesorhizobium sp.]RWO09441.1 MAG: HNH endonuclease [Mesorhizobium sp.]
MSLSQIERIRLDKAAVDEGFGLRRADEGDWVCYDSLGAPASIRLTCSDGEYVVAVNHAGVVTDLDARWERWPGLNGSPPLGFAAFSVSDTMPLHRLVREMWQLARALPIEPLRMFEAETRNLPRTTEIERLVVQRVGQNIFRDALFAYWGGVCAVTGVSELRLLRASHIKPWAQCETDGERLDVYNGLLLAAHLDAAFDAGLIAFKDSGEILISDNLAENDRRAMNINSRLVLRQVAIGHLENLAWHRLNLFASVA